MKLSPLRERCDDVVAIAENIPMLWAKENGKRLSGFL
jgi:DNA-binding NtrC family response regulator